MAWKNYGTKYNNKKVTVDGVTFDSKREAKRYQELLLLEKVGAIRDLKRQEKYVLIPAQYEPDIIGPKGGRKRGRIIERECSYYADFTYWDNERGCQVVEDTKGMRTKEYVIKRKLMLQVYGIRIIEI